MKLAQGIVPKMVARKSGKVMWISSMGGILVMPSVGVYCATKHAIEGIAGEMKAELAPYGVKVATVNPGLFDTGFNDTGAESHAQWYDAKRFVGGVSGSLSSAFGRSGRCFSYGQNVRGVKSRRGCRDFLPNHQRLRNDLADRA
ncbi:SDR family NAD(P)-dependent oxidoreductase [Pseudomonas chlororaphis]|nr:SDR family NAD(P)-dependent oxidoreductase [Pseudomonas chlororaphis]